jgi:hypothetical protein
MKRKRINKPGLSRRKFLAQAGASLSAFYIVPRFTLGGTGYIAPSDTVYIAGIGVGGKGTSDLTGFAKNKHAKVILLSDVDERMTTESRKNFPAAKFYTDFREMLAKEAANIDAVSVSTPDHTHAVAAMAAMQRGKHVYVQKPLTYSIQEARALAEAARQHKVVTQMGNQYASADHVRTAKEIVDAGKIGDVFRVQTWTNRPVWPQGIPSPIGKHEIPKDTTASDAVTNGSYLRPIVLQESKTWPPGPRRFGFKRTISASHARSFGDLSVVRNRPHSMAKSLSRAGSTNDSQSFGSRPLNAM